MKPSTMRIIAIKLLKKPELAGVIVANQVINLLKANRTDKYPNIIPENPKIIKSGTFTALITLLVHTKIFL